MALPRQTVSVPLGVGIDHKTDPKQLQLGKLHTLENGQFTRIGEVSPRHGRDLLAIDTADGDTLSKGVALAETGNVLTLLDGDSLYSYSSEREEWKNQGTTCPFNIDLHRAGRDTDGSLFLSVAKGGGYVLGVWDEASGSRIALFEESTQKKIWEENFVGPLKPNCKLIYKNSKFYVFVAGEFRVCVFDPSTEKYNPSNYVTITSDTPTNTQNNVFDVIEAGDHLLFAYLTGSPGSASVKVAYLKEDGTIGGVADGLPSDLITAATDGRNNLCLAANDDASEISVTYATDVDDFNIIQYPADLSGTPTPIEVTVATITLTGISTAYKENGDLKVFSSGIVNDDIALSVNVHIGTVSSGLHTENLVIPEMKLESELFRINDKVFGLLARIETDVDKPLQMAYYLVDEEGACVQRVLYQEAFAAISLSTHAPPRIAVDEDEIFIPVTRHTIIRAEENRRSEFFAPYILKLKVVDKALPITVIQNRAYIPSDTPFMFDGETVAELGFHMYPIVEASEGDSGELSQGSYQYCAIYEWTDAQGNIHRSAPSIPVTVDISQNDKAADVAVRPLRFTGKDDVRVVIFRTVADGTTFHRLVSLDNVPDTELLAYEDDSSADSDISDNEILYTTGGVLENIPPPPCRHIVHHGNRLFLFGTPDGSIYYSKEIINSEGVAFHDALRFEVVDGDGKPECGAHLDGKLICFKPKSIHYVIGSGPNDLGQQNDLSEPQTIPSDVGCEYPASVITTPIGVMFKSSSGFYLLDRKLQVHFIGEDVSNYNSLTVTSAVLLEKEGHVRWTHSNGVCIVFDYRRAQWAVFENTQVVSSTVWTNKHAFLRSDGSVLVENSSHHLDDTDLVPIKIVTPWIQTAGLSGFQRLYRAIFLGEKVSDHTFQVRIGYDFDQQWDETKTVDTSEISNGESLQLEVKPARQKCTAIRFEITDISTDNTIGSGFKISTLSLEYGVKPGLNKIAANRRLTG